MVMQDQAQLAEAIVPITGRRLTLPEGPIFHLQRAAQCDYVIGVFRPWAGYKNFGSDQATGHLAHFQHVLTFAATETAGRTGIHTHFAHAHIILPTSGRGVFSYDGVVTEAMPGSVIVQHGGTVHDQFEYSYTPASQADNCLTPLTVEPASEQERGRSFGFLELFVPMAFANVEIVPPKGVTPTLQRTAWDHPYHAQGARFGIQSADVPTAAYRPLAGAEGIEVRDAGTWDATGGLVATWLMRSAPAAGSEAEAVAAGVPGEVGGVDILFMVKGAASFPGRDGEQIVLGAGDTLTCSQGLVGDPVEGSPDMQLLRFFIAAKAQLLRERTPEEIARLEGLGERIITRSEVRPEADDRPVNFLSEGHSPPG